MSDKQIDNYINENYTMDENGHIKPRETAYSQLNKFFKDESFDVVCNFIYLQFVRRFIKYITF